MQVQVIQGYKDFQDTLEWKELILLLDTVVSVVTVHILAIVVIAELKVYLDTQVSLVFQDTHHIQE